MEGTSRAPHVTFDYNKAIQAMRVEYAKMLLDKNKEISHLKNERDAFRIALLMATGARNENE